MRVKVVGFVCFIACLAISISVFAQGKAGADPISGTWSGDWGPTAAHRNPVTVDLKWDGKALTGVVNPGPRAIQLQKTTFDAKTGAVHLEADAMGRGGATVRFVIDGKVENDTMTGSWLHDDRKGDFKITKK
jgi:hypothetical protein